jgi:ethanolamine utilization protein EutM
MAQEAIGTIETKGLVPMVEAADAALKAANVSYHSQSRVGSGMVSVTFTGNVAAVQAAVDAGADAAGKIGQVISVNVIARPHEDLSKLD